MTGESGDEILYLDKKAFEEKGHKVVFGREKGSDGAVDAAFVKGLRDGSCNPFFLCPGACPGIATILDATAWKITKIALFEIP